MSSSSELILYFMLLLITGSMGLIVYTMTRLIDRCNNRITAVKHQLVTMMLRDPDKIGRGPTTLHGDIDVVHPKTGEKLRASARFRIKH